MFILGSLESALHSVLKWTFSLRVMAEALQTNMDWKSAFLLEWGQFGPKFQVQGVVPTIHQPFFVSENDIDTLRISSSTSRIFLITISICGMKQPQQGQHIRHSMLDSRHCATNIIKVSNRLYWHVQNIPNTGREISNAHSNFIILQQTNYIMNWRISMASTQVILQLFMKILVLNAARKFKQVW